MNPDRLEQDLRAWMDATAPIVPRPHVVRATLQRVDDAPQLRPWRARLAAGGATDAGWVPRSLAPARLVVALLLLGAIASVGALLVWRLMPTPTPSPWTPTDAPLIERHHQSLVTLADGRVLMIGGQRSDAAGEPVLQAETWDPGTGAWIRSGQLVLPRVSSAAVLLSDGRVLVADLETDREEAASGSSELFDPVTGRFADAGRLQAGHGHGFGGAGWMAVMDPVLVALTDGRALVVGGVPEHGADATGPLPPVAEIWDGRATWNPTDPLPCDASRGAAAELPDGTVFIVCSQPYTGIGRMDARLRDPLWVPAAVVLDPSTGTFASVPPPTTMSTGAATSLPGGRILLTGAAIAGVTDPAEIREPDGTFRRLASPVNPVASSVVVTLSDGRILFMDRTSTTAWRFDPSSETFSALEMPAPLGDGSVAPLADGRALVLFGPDWESPGPRRAPLGPMVLDPHP